jgi:hypothetical protein
MHIAEPLTQISSNLLLFLQLRQLLAEFVRVLDVSTSDVVPGVSQESSMDSLLLSRLDSCMIVSVYRPRLFRRGSPRCYGISRLSTTAARPRSVARGREPHEGTRCYEIASVRTETSGIASETYGGGPSPLPWTNPPLPASPFLSHRAG